MNIMRATLKKNNGESTVKYEHIYLSSCIPLGYSLIINILRLLYLVKTALCNNLQIDLV